MLRHVAGLHVAHGLGEHRRQPRRRAPAEVAALERIRRVGESGRDLAEIGAAPDLLQRLLRAAALGVDLLGRRLLGDDHQDVGQPVFGLAPGLRDDRRQEIVDLGVAHVELAVDLAVAQPLHHDLVADLLAILGVGDAFALHRLPEVLRRHLVLLRDARNRPLDLEVVDAHAGLLRVLHQRALGDQPLEQLLVEHVGRRRRHLLRLHLLQNGALLLVQVELRQRLVVDHRDHAIERDDRAGRRPRGGRRGGSVAAGDARAGQRVARRGGAAACAGRASRRGVAAAWRQWMATERRHRALRGGGQRNRRERSDRTASSEHRPEILDMTDTR